MNFKIHLLQIKMRLFIAMTHFFVCFGLLSAGFLHAKPLSCSVSAESAILINADTGKILFQKNAFQPRYPASITKIATGLYIIKFFPYLMDKHVRCSKEALRCITEAEKSKDNYSKYPSYVLETDMSHMGLKVDEDMSFRNLLLGTMLVSGDDAANVIAETAGNGSIEKFMQDMNKYIASLGLKNTKFFNPHGLHHPEHVSTAFDIAVLTREALKEPRYMEIMKMTYFERPETNKQKAVKLRQTNKLLLKNRPEYYPYATSGKTGYHRRARHNLAATAEKDGRRLIAVVLFCEKRPNIFQDAKTLFQTAFQEEKTQITLLARGAQTFQRDVIGGKTTASTYTQEALLHSFYPSEEPKLRYTIVWDKVIAPLKKGDRIGELQLLADNVLVKKIPLLAANDVEKSFSYSLRQKCSFLTANPISLITFGGGLLLLALYFLLTKRKI